MKTAAAEATAGNQLVVQCAQHGLPSGMLLKLFQGMVRSVRCIPSKLRVATGLAKTLTGVVVVRAGVQLAGGRALAVNHRCAAARSSRSNSGCGCDSATAVVFFFMWT